MQDQGKESCEEYHQYVPCEITVEEKVKIDGLMKEAPDVRPRRILFKMT